MPVTAAAANGMLDNLAGLLDSASLHDGFPGNTGANEISGGTPVYARQTHTWNAAAAGNLDSSNAPVFDVASGLSILWAGWWDGASPQTFIGYAPLKQAADPGPFHYTVDIAGDQIQVDAHGFVNDDRIVFYGGAVPGGLTEGTAFHVVTATTDDFQVSATQGGAAIVLTTEGDKDVWVSQVRIETFAGQGTYTLTDADFALQPLSA